MRKTLFASGATNAAVKLTLIAVVCGPNHFPDEMSYSTQEVVLVDPAGARNST